MISIIRIQKNNLTSQKLDFIRKYESTTMNPGCTHALDLVDRAAKKLI